MKNSHSLQQSYLQQKNCSLLQTYFSGPAAQDPQGAPAPSQHFESKIIQEATNCTTNPQENEEYPDYDAKQRDEDPFE